jgi:hypothetical protein
MNWPSNQGNNQHRQDYLKGENHESSAVLLIMYFNRKPYRNNQIYLQMVGTENTLWPIWAQLAALHTRPIVLSKAMVLIDLFLGSY